MLLGSRSKHNNRVLFIVDHKYRDLPSLSLIGYFLRQMGYEVRYVALWQEDPVIRSFKPRHLVLPKPLYELRRLFRFKIGGHRLIVINTEGNPGGKTFKMNIEVPPDLYFFWNESQLQIDSANLSGGKTIFKLAGCPRTDFFRDGFCNLFPSREELLKQYKLSKGRKTITVATSTANVDLIGESLKRKIVILKRQTIEMEDFEKAIHNKKALKDMTVGLVRYIVSKYPDLNIVIKPHPNESIIFWQNFVASLPTDNIHLCIGEPINNLLRVSDLHIAHNACTTTFESLLSGVPAVEIHADQTMELFKTDRLQLPTYIVKTVEDIDRAIDRELYHADKGEDRNGKRDKILRSYIRKYYFKIDGLRCYEHARVIADFVEDFSNESINYGKFNLNHPEFIPLYTKLQAKWILSTILQGMGNVFRNPAPGNAQPDRMPYDKLIDDRGVYDSRVKQGDEEYWFKKFEDAGVGLEDFQSKYLDSKNTKIPY
jgi:surface carbohydrate biosynthesis protein